MTILESDWKKFTKLKKKGAVQVLWTSPGRSWCCSNKWNSEQPWSIPRNLFVDRKTWSRVGPDLWLPFPFQSATPTAFDCVSGFIRRWRNITVQRSDEESHWIRKLLACKVQCFRHLTSACTGRWKRISVSCCITAPPVMQVVKLPGNIVACL